MKTPFTLFFLFVSCLSFAQGKLYIETLKVNGTGDAAKKTEVVSVVATPYFEIVLGSQTHGDGTIDYIATKDIVKPSSMKNFKLETIAITDSKGEVLRFKSTTDFLNYMDSKGYALHTAIPNKYGAEYIFKKQ